MIPLRYKKSFLYGAAIFLLPILVGYFIGKLQFQLVGPATSVSNVINVIESRTQLPRYIQEQLSRVVIFEKYRFFRILTSILIPNGLLLTALLFTPSLVIMDKWLVNASQPYKKLDEKLSKITILQKIEPCIFLALCFGLNQGLILGWVSSFIPVVSLIELFTTFGSIEIFAYIMGLAFLVDMHLRERGFMVSENVKKLYKEGKLYFITAYLVLIVAGIIEAVIL